MALTALTRDDPRRVGRYRIRARLGAGGMGVVYLGFQGRRPLAIKVLRRELAESRAFRVRFGREIAAASRVEATCTAAFVSGDADADPPYFAVEYVPGPTLEAYVAERGPLHDDALRAFAAGIADGLAAIGRAGLVHRDLKPTNVLMTPTGPKVIDFGVAAGDDTLGLTQTGQRVGTPKWMAPEQVQGGAVTPATDVFAWGALVAFAATALPPFGTGDSEAVLYRVVHATPTVAGLDPVVGPLVERALAKEPDQRPSVEEIVKVLLEGDTTDPSTAAPDVAGLLERAWPREVPPDDASFPTAGQLRHYRRRRRLPVAIAALALVLIATAGTVYAIERSPSKPKRAAAPVLVVTSTTKAPTTTTVTTTPRTTTTVEARSVLPNLNPSESTDPTLKLAVAQLHDMGYEATQSAWYGNDVKESLLQALAAVPTGTLVGNCCNRVFFFVGTRYVGDDKTTSANLGFAYLTGDTVAVNYSMYHLDDPDCCPSAGTQTVRFHWDGKSVTPLDPIPPRDLNADPTRR